MCLRRGAFCRCWQKVPKERRQNQWIWNPLRAGDAFRVENLLPRAPNAQVYRCAFASSLRHHPLAAHAGPRCPGAAEIPPCVYRAARCGHRALRNFIDKRCVGGGVPDAPFHRTPCHAPVGGVPTPRRRYAPHLPAGHIIPAGGAEPAPTHRKKIPRTASLPSSDPSQKNDRPRRSFFCAFIGNPPRETSRTPPGPLL